MKKESEMKIPTNYHKMIVDELESVIKLCNDAKTIEDKLYFFSGSFGIINRVMNFYSDSTLIFMHQVLQTTYQAFSQRQQARKIPGAIFNTIPKVFFKALFSYLSDLLAAFKEEDKNKIWGILEKFSVLTYATSGNGFFLYLGEKLKIESPE